MKRVFAIVLAALSLFLAACSQKGGEIAPTPDFGAGYSVSRNSEYGEAQYDNGVQAVPESAPSAPAFDGKAADGADYAGFDTSAAPGEAERKIIQTADYAIETPAFAHSAQTVRDVAAAFGGYVQFSRMYRETRRDKTYSRGDFTIRVPAVGFERALSAIEQIGEVTAKSTGASDVTASYVDIEARRKVRQAEEERLLEMISKTDDIAGLIQLESRLSSARADIELYTSRLKNIDSLSSFATISVNLRETGDGALPGNPSFPQRIVGAFSASVDFVVDAGQGIVIFFAAAFVPLIVLAAIAGLTLGIVKLFLRKKRKDRGNSAPSDEPTPGDPDA
jgi:hypothetical protein